MGGPVSARAFHPTLGAGVWSGSSAEERPCALERVSLSHEGIIAYGPQPAALLQTRTICLPDFLLFPVFSITFSDTGNISQANNCRVHSVSF